MPRSNVVGEGELPRVAPPSGGSARPTYALAVLACGLLVLGGVMILTSSRGFIDLHIYLLGGQAILGGDDLYAIQGETGGWFTYPPFAALLFAPLALLPTGIVELLWTGGVVVCACLMVRRFLPSRPWLAIAVAVALPMTTVLFNLLHFGQIGALLTLLVLLDVVALQRGSRYAGVLTGVAAAIKLTPALFLVWMLVLRRRHATLRGVAVFLGASAVAALILPGASRQFWTEALWHTDRVGHADTVRNQSLFGVLLRAGLDRPVVLGVVAVVGVAGILAAAYTARRAGLMWGALLAGCVMVLVTPIAWTHHYTWPLLAAVALVGTAPWTLRALGAGFLAVLLQAQELFGSSWAVVNARVLGLAALVVTIPGSAHVLTSPAAARAWRLAVPAPVREAITRPAAVTGAALLGSVALTGWIVGVDPIRPPFQGFDTAWHQLMLATRSAGLTDLALVADALGRSATWIAVTAAVTTWYVVQRRWWAASYVVVSALAVTGVMAVVKNVLLRPRPDGGMVEVHVGSYPSGHVGHLTAIALAVALLLPAGRSRWFGALATALVIATMSWSRTYLSVHWLSDTVAGAALAIGICLLLWLPFAGVLDREARDRRPPDSRRTLRAMVPKLNVLAA